MCHTRSPISGPSPGVGEGGVCNYVLLDKTIHNDKVNMAGEFFHSANYLPARSLIGRHSPGHIERGIVWK